MPGPRVVRIGKTLGSGLSHGWRISPTYNRPGQLLCLRGAGLITLGVTGLEPGTAQEPANLQQTKKGVNQMVWQVMRARWLRVA